MKPDRRKRVRRNKRKKAKLAKRHTKRQAELAVIEMRWDEAEPAPVRKSPRQGWFLT